MAVSAQELAYEFALQSVTSQRGRLDSLRSRAGTILAATSLVTGFLGAEALKDTKVNSRGQQVADPTLQPWEIVGMVAFVVVALTCIWMLRPQRNRWRFEMSPAILIEDYVDGGETDIKQVHRDMALFLEENYDANEPHLGRLMWWHQFAAAGLLVEIVAWMVDLGLR
jgi:hypothetical protein